MATAAHRHAAGGAIPAAIPNQDGEREAQMLSWALGFFIVALIAAFFGFGGIAAGAASIAKILFVGFLVLAVVSLIAGLVRRPTI